MLKRDWLATARTLSEALPYLQRYDGATVVVKFGGHAMGDAASMERFARDVVLMKQCGVNPVVVHGGGPMINDMLERLQIKTEFRDGLRVTTAETVEVVEMVLAGVINKRIVSAINAQGGRAVGLSGKDANLMICEKAMKTRRDPDSHIEQVLDLGFVGEPVAVDPGVLRSFIDSDLVPVVAPVGAGRQPEETFNINGDTAAGAIASAMQAERLMLLTDVEGVKDKSGQVLGRLSATGVMALKADGTIAGGMIPKVDTALAAIAAGVEAAVILDGRAPHAVLLELFTEHGAGTMITAGDNAPATATTAPAETAPGGQTVTAG
ncbi:MAG: acetylglutamate kinase [Pseudomonadota bacterium]